MRPMLGTPALSPRKEEWPGKVVDTHMAQEAPGRQGPVGHMVGAGVSEFKGNAGVPPTPEFAGVDDSGLGWGEEGDTSANLAYGPPAPPLSHPGPGFQRLHPTVVQLHVQVPVTDAAPGVVAGTQIVAQPRVPEAAHGEGLGPLLSASPEAEYGLQGVALAELRGQACVGREEEEEAAGRPASTRPSLPSQMKKLKLRVEATR